jgi:hypothetical protein
MNDPVRLPDGSVSTIAELEKQGRITFRRYDNFLRRNGSVRIMHFAEIADGEGWEISKFTYERKGRVFNAS